MPVPLASDASSTGRCYRRAAVVPGGRVAGRAWPASPSVAVLGPRSNRPKIATSPSRMSPRHHEPQRPFEPPSHRGVLLRPEPERPEQQEREQERGHVPQEQRHDPGVDHDREPPRPVVPQPASRRGLTRSTGAERPHPAQQEAHRRRVGVRDRLHVGPEQALGVVPDPGEPVEADVAEQPEHPRGREDDEAGEPTDDHRPVPPAGPGRQRPVRVGVSELVREEQDERDVQPPPSPDAGGERDQVDDDGADPHREWDPQTEAAVQPDRERRDHDDHQVDAQEPQGTERDRGARGLHPAQERRLAPEPRPGGRADVREVEHDLHHEPRRRGTRATGEEPLEPAPDEGPGRPPLPSVRVVGHEVREPAHEEEDRHHLERPGEQPQAGGDADRARRWITPPSQWLIEMNQCPNTTARIDAARKKSIERSRRVGWLGRGRRGRRRGHGRTSMDPGGRRREALRLRAAAAGSRRSARCGLRSPPLGTSSSRGTGSRTRPSDPPVRARPIRRGRRSRSACRSWLEPGRRSRAGESGERQRGGRSGRQVVRLRLPIVPAGGSGSGSPR